MSKVIILSGLPASGKSTWAKKYIKDNPNTKRTNKDELRAMLDNSRWSKSNENFVLRVRDFIIEETLKLKKDIIVDDTNLAPKHIKRISEIAKQYGAEVEIKEFNVSLDECIKRDKLRDNPVGERIIRDMYNRYIDPYNDDAKVVLDKNGFKKVLNMIGVYPNTEHRLNPVIYNEDLPYCLIVDIDGTLAHRGDRSPYDYSKVKDDKVNRSIWWVVKNMSEDVEIIVFSGRENIGDCYVDTFDWLKKNGIAFSGLFMRKNGDHRKDAIVKKEMFETLIKDKYNVIGVIDDRKSVCKMWYELGLAVFRVGDPNGDF